MCMRGSDLELLLVLSEQDVKARPIDDAMKALDCSRSQQGSMCMRGGDLELLLVFSEQDVEGPSKAPHGEHQEQQEPLHISHH